MNLSSVYANQENPYIREAQGYEGRIGKSGFMDGAMAAFAGRAQGQARNWEQDRQANTREALGDEQARDFAAKFVNSVLEVSRHDPETATELLAREPQMETNKYLAPYRGLKFQSRTTKDDWMHITAGDKAYAVNFKGLAYMSAHPDQAEQLRNQYIIEIGSGGKTDKTAAENMYLQSGAASEAIARNPQAELGREIDPEEKQNVTATAREMYAQGGTAGHQALNRMMTPPKSNLPAFMRREFVDPRTRETMVVQQQLDPETGQYYDAGEAVPKYQRHEGKPEKPEKIKKRILYSPDGQRQKNVAVDSDEYDDLVAGGWDTRKPNPNGLNNDNQEPMPNGKQPTTQPASRLQEGKRAMYKGTIPGYFHQSQGQWYFVPDQGGLSKAIKIGGY